jgi:hypothetical protein
MTDYKTQHPRKHRRTPCRVATTPKGGEDMASLNRPTSPQSKREQKIEKKSDITESQYGFMPLAEISEETKTRSEHVSDWREHSKKSKLILGEPTR